MVSCMTNISDRMMLAKAFVDGREELQPIPFLVHILRAFITAESALDLRPIIDSVEREPTVAARVIAHAQSAAYHSLKPALSVSESINKMGLNNAKRIIMALALKEACDFGRCPAFSIKRYMINTIRVAHIASIIGQPVAGLSVDETASIPPSGWYCIGLLHSIGLLYIVEHEPDGMGILLGESEDGGLIKAEFAMLGFDHYDVSTALLAGWNLPPPFHISLPYLRYPSYRGHLWRIAAVIDLARCLASMVMENKQDENQINGVTDEWTGRWGIALPAPLPITSTLMDEATSLMEAVL